MLNILNCDPPTLPLEGEWSQAFRKMINTCLKKQPDDRPNVKQLLECHKAFFSKAKDEEYLKKQFLINLPPMDSSLEQSLQLEGKRFLERLRSEPKGKKHNWDFCEE